MWIVYELSLYLFTFLHFPWILYSLGRQLMLKDENAFCYRIHYVFSFQCLADWMLNDYLIFWAHFLVANDVDIYNIFSSLIFSSWTEVCGYDEHIRQIHTRGWRDLIFQKGRESGLWLPEAESCSEIFNNLIREFATCDFVKQHFHSQVIHLHWAVTSKLLSDPRIFFL